MAVVFSCCHCPYVVAWEDRLNDVARDYAGRAGLVAVNSNAGLPRRLLRGHGTAVEGKGLRLPFRLRRDAGDRRGPTPPPARPRSSSSTRRTDSCITAPPTPITRTRSGDEPYLRRRARRHVERREARRAETPAVGCTIKWRPSSLLLHELERVLAGRDRPRGALLGDRSSKRPTSGPGGTPSSSPLRVGAARPARPRVLCAPRRASSLASRNASASSAHGSVARRKR